MRLERIGYGAGDRDPKDTPNVLRDRRWATGRSGRGRAVVAIECEIDDMNPQLFGPLMDRLSAAGALDVFYVAVQMKKNRPGHARDRRRAPASAKRSRRCCSRETTTIGVRYQEMLRDRLDREIAVDRNARSARYGSR